MHTQKKYGHTIDEIRKDRIPVAAIVPIDENDSMLAALSKEIRGIEEYCMRERPDIVLVDADRDEAFAGAIVAGHLGIPIAHLSGGDVTGPVVDDQIRNAITKFAHLHFPLTKKSGAQIRRMNEKTSRIFPLGTTAFDVISTKNLMSRTVLAKKYHLDPRRPWLLFVQHPTALDSVSVQKQINESLAAFEKTDGEKIIIYPNSDEGSDTFVDAITAFSKKTGATLVRSFPRTIFLSFLGAVDVMLGNSSAGIVEAGFFKTPVVNIGNRELGRERGVNVINARYDRGAIGQALHKALSKKFKSRIRTMKHPYGSGNVGRKIVRILEKTNFDAIKNKHI